MFNIITIKSKIIADFLNSELHGKDLELSGVSSLNKPLRYSLSFLSNSKNELDKDLELLYLVPLKFNYIKSNYSVIKVENPRLSFSKIIDNFFNQKKNNVIQKSVLFGENCKIGSNVGIGHNTVIGKNVVIGNNTIINNNVVIDENTKIGADCYIKSGCVIGEDGFGFTTAKDQVPYRFIHLGSVEIGNNVEIGASSVIARGALDSTVIKNDVKIDDLVFIAHNCIIGSKTIITAHAELSGSVIIGENCWIGPNSSIIQKIKIGNNVVIGIGAIIRSDIGDNMKFSSLESTNLKTLVKIKKFLKL